MAGTRGRLTVASQKIEVCIANGCAKVAVYVSRSPKKTLWVSVFCCLVASLGWLNVDEERRPEKLIMPQHTRALRDQRWVEDNFNDADAPSTVLYNRRNGDTNLLSREALSDMFDVYESILKIDVGRRKGYDHRGCAKVSWSDRPHELCQKQGILAFWDWNRRTFEADSDLLETINEKNKVDCCNPLSRVIDLSTVAAKLERNDPEDPSRVTDIGALKMSFFLTTSLNARSREDPKNARLEKKFDKQLRKTKFHSVQRALPLTAFGFRENRDTALETDRILINLAVVIIILYACFALYNYRYPEKSRAILALGAVACVLLSTLASFGAAMAFGLTFSPSSGVAVFLVLSIGLDDSFVLAGTIDEPFFYAEPWYDPTASPLENDARRVLNSKEDTTVEEVAALRIIKTLRHSGPSITITSITDATALFAGSLSVFPEIRIFNAFGGSAILVDYLMQLTFFVALLTLDQRRRLRNKIQELQNKGAVIESFSRAIEATPSSSQKNEGASFFPETEDAAAAKKASEPQKKLYVDEDVVFWASHYPKYLLSLPGKVFVLTMSIGVLAVAVVGCLRFRVDFAIESMLVDSGPFAHAKWSWDFNRRHFPNGDPTWVGLYTKHADYFAAKDDMHHLIDGYADLGFVMTESLNGNWFYEHEKWLVARNRTVTSNDEWLESLGDFLKEDEGLRFVDKIKFDKGSSIVGAEIDTRWKNADARGIRETQQMLKARRRVRSSDHLGTVIVYNDQFMWYESHRYVAAPSTILSMVIAVSAIFVVLIVLLGDILAALYVSLVIAAACTCTFGAIYWYGDTVNFVTAFFIVLAVGLSADAPAHICRAYLDSRLGTRNLRAKEAVAKLGPSVFRGGVSTIVGLAITGFCVTWIFQTFFKYLMTILVLSLWNGLALTPVLCSIIGPMPTHARLGFATAS